MAELAAGTVLGDRFEVLGAVGRGGSAVVYLALDRLRSERVALKVVHAHLTEDPAVRRRLQREVLAAGMILHDAALVPHDLHELDGRLALSMPFHPGQTLSERVAADGPLSPDDVRALGIRVAGALAEAHRAGVLHRDVTASNVLLSTPGEAVLTDFGLARLQHGSSRSTGLLGTAGYAAPEVYAGERGDPRSDLYGLGAALYLAATGRPAFDARDPMAALRQQLEDAYEPVRKLRPEVPAELAETIEALLRRDPLARPQGAREVVDRLEGRIDAPLPSSRPRTAKRQFLPPGQWTVVVKERDEDRGRRSGLRSERHRGPSTTEGELHRIGKVIVAGVKEALGFGTEDALTPEDLLARAVAEEAEIDPDALGLPAVIYDKRFRLVDRTDEETASRLAHAAQTAGFRGRAVQFGGEENWRDLLAIYFWVPIAVGWSMFPFLGGIFAATMPPSMAGFASMLLLPALIALSIVLPIFASARRRDSRASRYPVAYRADLKGVLADHDAEPRFDAEPTPQATASVEAPVPAEPESRGSQLLTRARTALAALDAAVASRSETLPEPAIRDLRSTSADLVRSAEALAVEVDELDGALGPDGAHGDALSMVRARLGRLQTMKRAGDDVDANELARLEAAVAQHEADLAAEARVEARLAAATAQLLEIASTASRVRRELLADAAPHQSADEAVKRLRDEVRAADEARREAGRRQAAARGQRS